MALTPYKLTKIRGELEPLAKAAGVDIDAVLLFCKDKDAELEGIINEDGIVKLAKTKFNLEAEEPKETKKEIKQKEEKKEMKNSSMEEFWEGVEFVERKEFPPFLSIKNGITFTLKLSNPKAPPRPHIDKTYKTPQFLWDVVLVDIESETAIDKEVYEVGKEYTLALNANRATKRFKEFWLESEMKVSKFTFKRIGNSFQTDYVFKVA